MSEKLLTDFVILQSFIENLISKHYKEQGMEQSITDYSTIKEFLAENNVNVTSGKKDGDKFITLKGSKGRCKFVYVFKNDSVSNLVEAYYISNEDELYPLYTKAPQTVRKAKLVTLKWLNGELTDK